MGALFDMKAFFRWLEESEIQALVRRRDLLAEVLAEHLRDPEVIAEAQHLLKLIEREIVVRTMK